MGDFYNSVYTFKEDKKKDALVFSRQGGVKIHNDYLPVKLKKTVSCKF